MSILEFWNPDVNFHENMTQTSENKKQFWYPTRIHTDIRIKKVDETTKKVPWKQQNASKSQKTVQKEIPKETSKNKIEIKPYIPTSFSELQTMSPLKPVLRKKENPSFSLSFSQQKPFQILKIHFEIKEKKVYVLTPLRE